MRSMFAVMFGFMIMIVAKVLLTVILLKILGPNPDNASRGTLGLSLAFAILAAMIGGIVTAVISPSSPVKHTAVLAFIVFALSAIPFLRRTGLQPIWYQEVVLVAPSLCAFAAGSLFVRNQPTGD